MAAVTELATDVGTRAACRALFAPRASYYRDRRAASCTAATALRPRPARALSPEERNTVLDHLHGERFQDRSQPLFMRPLLDEGHYYCSIRTMHRFLKQQGESRERRDQLTHPPYQKPELLATAPISSGAGTSVCRRSSIGDERRNELTSRARLAGQGANHRKRLGTKALVVSVAEKVPQGIR